MSRRVVCPWYTSLVNKYIMCNTSGIVFGAINLRGEIVKNKSVLEVGSLDVNGSLQDIIKCDEPREYVGVDIEAGPGVDEVLGVEYLIERFGADRFDVVFATELVEHVEDWQAAFRNLKMVCKPGGMILVTTRSKGFQYHGFPYDFWRYELDDMKQIFSDCKILKLQSDPMRPGVFVLVQKPIQFTETNYKDIALYSVVTHRRCKQVTEQDKRQFARSYDRRKKLLRVFKAVQNSVLSINQKLFRE